MLFEPKLMANQLKRARATAAAGDDEAAAREQLDTEVYIRVEHIGDDGAGAGAAAASPAVFWHYDKFVNRLYLMREMYQAWVEHGRSLAGTAFAGDEGDPFVDPAGDVLIGTSTIYLDALYHCLAVNESTPIIDYKGAELGELLVRIVPHAADSTAAAAAASAAGGGSGAPAADGAAAAIGVAAADDDLDAESLEELRGHRVGLSLCIDGARGLPPTFAGVHARYTFFLGAPERTPADAVAKLGCINPRIAFARVYTPVVSDELLKYVKAETLEVEVWGQPLAATTRPTSATSTPAASRRASDGGGEPAAPSTPTATQASISQTVAPAMPATPAPAQLASAEAVLAQPAAAGLTPLPPALALPTLAPTAASTGNAAAAAPVPASDASAAAAVTASGLQPPSAPLPTILPGVPTPAPAASSAKPRRSRFCAIA